MPQTFTESGYQSCPKRVYLPETQAADLSNVTLTPTSSREYFQRPTWIRKVKLSRHLPMSDVQRLLAVVTPPRHFPSRVSAIHNSSGSTDRGGKTLRYSREPLSICIKTAENVDESIGPENMREDSSPDRRNHFEQPPPR